MKHLDWTKNANIYEVNIRQYTKEGTINVFREHLPRLQKMGVDIIWIMPIQPIGIKNRKGVLGSYYSISNYIEVNHEFGTLDDFIALVKDAHALGLHVLLDWVANHTAWDHVWTIQHPDYYQKDENGNFKSPWDWSDVIALDYNNLEMRKSMIEAMQYWVEMTDIDGFRCDMAGMVPVDFWEESRFELEKIKPMFMLAEDEEVVSLLDKSFDMNFTWEMHHLLNEIARGDKKASEIWWKLASYNERYPSDAYRMYFTSNHDENSHSGTAVERMGHGAKSFALLTYLLPGMPLIYSGQETATDKRLSFFEKDEIEWTHIALKSFYKQLNRLKGENESLWCGNFGGDIVDLSVGQNDHVFGVKREKNGNRIISVLNLTNTHQQFTLNTDAYSGTYEDVFSGELVYPSMGYTFNLEPWEFVVLKLINQ